MKKLSLILTLALIIGAISCNKYENGPSVSLKSKKSRVANIWIIDEYIDADGEIEKEDDSETYEFSKDGNVTVSYDGDSEKGKWEFRNDKESIAFIFNGDEEVYLITKLKEKEFWIADEDKDEIHFIPKN